MPWQPCCVVVTAMKCDYLSIPAVQVVQFSALCFVFALVANAVRIRRSFSLGGRGRGQAVSVQMEMFPATATSI